MDSCSGFRESPVSQRAGQKERTRAHILAAALALMRNAGEDVVTIRAVAAVAGVTERTVYRHFKNREALLRSAWRRMIALIGVPSHPETADALVERPRSLFPLLDQERELVSAFLHSEARRIGRPRFTRERQQTLIRCVQDERDYLDDHSLRRLAAIASLIASPYAWQFMHAFWGFSGKQAGKAAAEAIEILLNRRFA